MWTVLLQQLLHIPITTKKKKKIHKCLRSVWSMHMTLEHKSLSLNKLVHPLPYKHINCPFGDKKVTDLIYLLIYEIYFQLLSFLSFSFAKFAQVVGRTIGKLLRGECIFSWAILIVCILRTYYEKLLFSRSKTQWK